MPETAIVLGSNFADLAELTEVDDAAFLQSVPLRKSADKRLVSAARGGDLPSFCGALRRSLAARQSGGTKRSLDQLVPTLLQPLWSQLAWDDTDSASSLGNLLLDLDRRLRKSREVARKASRSVHASLDAVPPAASPWAALVGLHVLLAATDLLDDAALLRLWRITLSAVASSPGASISRSEGELEFAGDRQLLVGGELPWLAGHLFGDIKGGAKLARQGRSVLRTQLEALTDADGTPHAGALHRLPLTLAVLTRAVSIGRLFDDKLLNHRCTKRYAQLVARAALMVHADGRLALSNGASFAPASLLRSASVLAGITASRPPGRRLQQLPDDAPRSSGRQRRAAHTPPKPGRSRRRADRPPSTQSDWAELACMRNNWGEGGDSCIVAYHSVTPQLSVSAFERPLFDGDWPLEIEVDGVPLELTADWSCVCWFSDEDADYAELEQETDSGVTLLRQVLLSRTDHWLLLADTAKPTGDAAPAGGTIRMRMTLPLAPRVDVGDNRWTRELDLQAGKLKGRVYPLGLPQERIQKADGTLRIDDAHLVLEQTGNGGLHMPLVIDWSPQRQREQAVWQKLTVAEDGQRLPPHIACGQRLRVGKHQWLFYRSLQAGETGRTVLGHHTPHETVIAEFTRQGEVEPIVMVE
jgi:hypothetical protein